MAYTALSKKEGLNAHLTVCKICGTTLPEIVFLGNEKFVWLCNQCNIYFFSRSKKPAKCPECNSPGKFMRKARQCEKLPIWTCDKCKEEEEQIARIVSEGGVYWKCKDCGSRGVIKADANYAKTVRAYLKIEPPDPCGVEFTKEDCIANCKNDN